jgi:hypothetical protein
VDRSDATAMPAASTPFNAIDLDVMSNVLSPNPRSAPRGGRNDPSGGHPREPGLILRKQLDRIEDRAVAQMKADAIEYELRGVGPIG